MFTKLILTSLLLFGCLSSTAFTQSLKPAKSDLTIYGSSTLHNWDVKATNFEVDFAIPNYWFEHVDLWEGNDVSGLEVRVKINDLESGRGKMNRDLREALKEKEHPEIVFIWESLTVNSLEENEGRILNVEGFLDIAGVKNAITFKSEATLNNKGEFIATGEVEVDMTDYSVDPPTALFGALKTDKDVRVSYKIVMVNDSGD